jgi:hypothetical protein
MQCSQSILLGHEADPGGTLSTQGPPSRHRGHQADTGATKPTQGPPSRTRGHQANTGCYQFLSPTFRAVSNTIILSLQSHNTNSTIKIPCQTSLCYYLHYQSYICHSVDSLLHERDNGATSRNSTMLHTQWENYVSDEAASMMCEVSSRTRDSDISKAAQTTRTNTTTELSATCPVVCRVTPGLFIFQSLEGQTGTG